MECSNNPVFHFARPSTNDFGRLNDVIIILFIRIEFHLSCLLPMLPSTLFGLVSLYIVAYLNQRYRSAELGCQVFHRDGGDLSGEILDEVVFFQRHAASDRGYQYSNLPGDLL